MNKNYKYNMNTMIFLMFLCMILYNIGHPGTPGLIELRNLKKSISGEFLATMSTAMFLSSPYLGALADNIGMKKIFVFLPCLYGISQLIFGFSGSLPMMFFARILAGFVSGGTHAVVFGYVSQISTKENKAKNISKISAATVIGGAIGQKLGGLLALKDTRFPFGAQFVLGIIVSLFIAILMKEIVKTEKIKEKKNLNPLSTFKYIAELDKEAKMFCFIIFLSGIGIFSYASALNYFLKFDVKVSSDVIGTFVMASSLVAFFGISVLLQKLLKKYKELSIYKFMLFFGISLMLLILILVMKSNMKLGLEVYILMAFYTMTYEIIKSLGNSIMAKKYKSEQGKILGVASAVSFLGNAIGSLLSGYLRATNPYLPFIVNICIITIVFNLLHMKRKR